MTLTQFSSCISALARKLNWDTQVAAIPAGNKPKAEAFPLVPDKSARRKSERERGAHEANPQRVAETFDAFEQQLRSFVSP